MKFEFPYTLRKRKFEEEAEAPGFAKRIRVKLDFDQRDIIVVCLRWSASHSIDLDDRVAARVYRSEQVLAFASRPSIIYEMENFINRTKQISAFIFETNNNPGGVVRPSPRTWRKGLRGLDFKRLSITSWEDIESTDMQRVSLPKGPFRIEFYPCESQPSSCRVFWQVTPCLKVPGKTRRCKIVQNCRSKESKRPFSANIACVDDKIFIWGSMKDDRKEGEDFELVLTAPQNKFQTYGHSIVVQEGSLKRGCRKKDSLFVTTHDGFVLS